MRNEVSAEATIQKQILELQVQLNKMKNMKKTEIIEK